MIDAQEDAAAPSKLVLTNTRGVFVGQSSAEPTPSPSHPLPPGPCFLHRLPPSSSRPPHAPGPLSPPPSPSPSAEGAASPERPSSPSSAAEGLRARALRSHSDRVEAHKRRVARERDAAPAKGARAAPAQHEVAGEVLGVPEGQSAHEELHLCCRLHAPPRKCLGCRRRWVPRCSLSRRCRGARAGLRP